MNKDSPEYAKAMLLVPFRNAFFWVAGLVAVRSVVHAALVSLGNEALPLSLTDYGPELIIGLIIFAGERVHHRRLIDTQETRSSNG